MPSNVLSIGCSHSLGYYDKEDDPSYQNTWPAVVNEEYKEKIKHWRHIALPGHGTVDYCWFLLELEKNNLLDEIDILVIQYTSEPRIIFYPIPNIIQKFFRGAVHQSFINSDREYEALNIGEFIRTRGLNVSPLNMASTSIISHVIDGVFTTDGYVYNTKDKLENTKQWEKATSSFADCNAVRLSIKLSYQNIQDICKRNNIKLFQFVWPYMRGLDWIIDDDIICVDKDIDNYRKISNKNLHVNKIGCDMINNNILEYLKSNDF